jgi:hypothetical protein
VTRKNVVGDTGFESDFGCRGAAGRVWRPACWPGDASEPITVQRRASSSGVIPVAGQKVVDLDPIPRVAAVVRKSPHLCFARLSRQWRSDEERHDGCDDDARRGQECRQAALEKSRKSTACHHCL